MTAPLPSLASRLPLSRRSTLLLDLRAEDVSLDARSGQTLTFARAGTAMAPGVNGIGPAGYGELRHGYVDTDGDGIPDATAILLERALTQLATYTRDLTNAAWTKSNVTTALTETGVDGQVNSATKLTASAGNGTALQAITSGSAQRITSAYVRRITGTGTIQMTQDNGGSWTTIALTSSWQRFSLAAVTSANPTIGFRLVTNGDAIAVDYVQHELGAYASTPVARTSAAATRVADALQFTAAWPFADSFTVYVKVAPWWASLSGGIGTDAYALTLGNAVARVSLSRSGSAGLWTASMDTSGTDATKTATAPTTALQEVAVQVSGCRAGATIAMDVGSGMSVASSAASAITALGSLDVFIGGFSAAGNELGGGLLGVKIARGLVTLAQMRAAR